MHLPITLTLSANAGVMLTLDDLLLWIDVLHDNHAVELEFPSLSEEMTETVFARAEDRPPDLFLVTHDHPDHYSEALAEQAKKAFPACKFILPWKHTPPRPRVYPGRDLTVTAVPLPHRYVSPEKFRTVDHYGLLIRYRSKTIFVPGDADPFSEEIQQLVPRLHPDLVILPFLWITLSSSRQVLDGMSPGGIVLLHLPFPDRDPYGYNHLAVSCRDRFCPQAVILNTFLQSVSLTI